MLSKAVMQFWHSAEVNLNGDDPSVCPEKSVYSVIGLVGVDRNDVSKDKNQESNMVLVFCFDLFFVFHSGKYDDRIF